MFVRLMTILAILCAPLMSSRVATAMQADPIRVRADVKQRMAEYSAKLKALGVDSTKAFTVDYNPKALLGPLQFMRREVEDLARTHLPRLRPGRLIDRDVQFGSRSRHGAEYVATRSSR